MHCNTCLTLHMPHAEVWSLVIRRTVYLIAKIELFFFIDFFILIEKNIVFHFKYSGLADQSTASGRPPPASELCPLSGTRGWWIRGIIAIIGIVVSSGDLAVSWFIMKGWSVVVPLGPVSWAPSRGQERARAGQCPLSRDTNTCHSTPHTITGVSTCWVIIIIIWIIWVLKWLRTTKECMEMENCKNQAGRDGADVKKRWKALMYLKYGTNYGILSAQQTQIPEPRLQK